MFYYIFDLLIDSEIPLPLSIIEPSHIKQVDVRIRYGAVPSELPDIIRRQSWYALNQREGIFSIPHVAAFHISEGETIVIQVEASTDLRTLHVWLLGVGLSMLLHQRGILQLHASTVVKQGKALLICGQKGAGKSTTAANFIRNGYLLMADDVSVVKQKNDIFYVFSAFPQQNLIPDALEKLHLSSKDLHYLHNVDSKYVYSQENAFYSGSAQIEAICVLEKHDAPLSIMPIVGQNKLFELQNHIIRKYFMVIPELITSQTILLMEISSQIPVLHIQRPNNEDVVEELYKQVEERLSIYRGSNK